MSRIQVNLSKLDKVPSLRKLWIDGDIFVYTIGFAVEDRVEYPDGGEVIYGDLNLAKRLLDNRIRSFTVNTPKRIVVRLVITGDERCWRKDIDETYKSGRGRKPKDYQGLRDYMRSLPIVYETENGLEADDFMAAATSADPNATAIMSFDKDFFTAPGMFIHLAQNSSARLYNITPRQALCFLMFQALAGDRVDSYKGVRYIGSTKAGQMLQLCELKGLTVRQAYLLLKACVLKRQKQFSVELKGRNLWHDFRTCLDLAALTWADERPGLGIGIARVYKLRRETFEYFLPYYDDGCTYKHTQLKL